ncbi:MAG TPA: hypothetical protein VFT66_18165 [Roseiflexaceae bacterium]|nr:hypothetical protein [Roseiflexaceae bacterium]
MAESDTILQLGIEAAREGNREEARNLFSLLTRQEPDNVQGWLWLAGVANDADERRAALERVVELDPSNEMARRGLQAMGVSPSTRTQPAAPTEPGPIEEEVAPVAPVAPTVPDRELTDDERLAAELDMAYDDYDSVERVGGGFRNEPTPVSGERDEDLDADAVGATSGRGRRGSRRYGNEDAADYDASATGRRRPMGLLLGLVVAIALILCVLFWVVPNFINRGANIVGTNINGNANIAGIGTSEVGGVAGTGNSNAGTGAITDTSGLTGTGELSNTNGVTGTNNVTLTGNLSGTTNLTSTTPLTSTAAPAEQPTAAPAAPAEPTAAPAEPTAAAGQPGAQPPATGNLGSANPQPVPVGESIQAGDWSYTFPGFCLGSCATVVGKQIGSFTAQGNYVVALVLVSNNTGTAQPIPQNFFVVKDAQGNVYTPQPQVSSAYLIRGVNADRSQEDAVPAGATNTSLPLVFDIPSGASNLMLFSSANPSQGFQILNSVP